MDEELPDETAIFIRGKLRAKFLMVPFLDLDLFDAWSMD
jgi:hypothetical protein